MADGAQARRWGPEHRAATLVSLGEARRLLAGDEATVAMVGARLGRRARGMWDAVLRPLGRAELRLGVPTAPWSVPLRWSPASGLALVPEPPSRGRLEAHVVPAAGMVDLVARLVDLGPRPVVEGDGSASLAVECVLPAELLDVWLRGAPRSILDAVVDDPAVRALLLALRSDLLVTWALTSQLPSRDGRLLSRTLRVVDAGGAGIWLLHRLPNAGGVAMLRRTTPSTVWDLLAGVLATRPLDEVAA